MNKQIGCLLFFCLFFWAMIFTQPSAAEEIKLGGLYSLSGAVADMGQDYRDAAILAVEYMNKMGGPKFRLIAEDHRMQTKDAVAAFQKLIEVDKVSFVHMIGSGPGLAIKPIAEQKGIMLFGGVAHAEFTKDSTMIIRHGNISDNDARILAAAVAKESPQKVVNIYIQGDWGDGFTREFEKDLRAADKGVQITSIPHLPDANDFKAEIVSLLKAKPDAFVVASYGVQSGMLIKQIKQLGYTGRIYVNNGFMLSADARNFVKDQHITGFQYQDYPDFPKAYSEEFKQRFGREPGPLSLYGYTDIELLTSAITKAGPNPPAVVQYIKQLGKFSGRYETIQIQPSGDILIDTVMKEM